MAPTVAQEPMGICRCLISSTHEVQHLRIIIELYFKHLLTDCDNQMHFSDANDHTTTHNIICVMVLTRVTHYMICIPWKVAAKLWEQSTSAWPH